MPNQRIVHPRLLSHMARFHYPNLVSVQVMTIVFDSSNEQIVTWVDDPLLVDLKAYIEPMDSKVETRRADQTIVVNGWIVTLAGYYPLLKEKDQATDDLGRVHNILGVDIDAFKTQTTLITEIING